MKEKLPYLIILCLSCLILFAPKKRGPVRTDVICDTVYLTDAVMISAPIASSETIVQYKPYPVTRIDTIRDTAFVYIPITQTVYRDSLYTAWVSGYSAKLDSIELYNRIQTITVHDKVKRKRFGIGLQVGYGFPYGAYAGVGLSYNLFNL